MKKSSFRFDNVWLWGVFFFLVLIAVNWVLFYSFQQLDESKGYSVWRALWEYIKTDSFKTVTISLLIPVILAIMGGIFKINDAIGERIKKAQEERANEQRECIKKTYALFNELEKLSSEVRHFKRGTDEKQSINDIIRKLEQFLSESGNTLSMLLAAFPNLADKYTGCVFTYFNLLFNVTTSIAYYIRDSKTENDKIKKLQNALEVIRDSIDYMAFENILKVLNYSIELSRSDISTRRKKEIDRDEIDFRLDNMTNWIDSMVGNDSGFFNDYLPSAKHPKVAEFRKIAEKVEKWQRDEDNEDKDITDYPDIKTFRDSFSAIPREVLESAWPIDYSDEDIEKMADWLGSEYMLLEVEERA